MDVSKLKPGREKEGIPYAVCPACDNPIRIIALYKRHENSPSPYGRHVAESIYKLASYDQAAYDRCPYVNPGMKLEKNMLRPEDDSKSLNILQLLRDQFDRVIYLLQRSTGIVFSEKLAQDMLKSFLYMRGHLYIGTNICNLPLMFGYMTTSQSLYGRIINKESPLMEALQKNKDLEFSDKNQLKSSKGKFIDINFTFIEHKTTRHDTEYKETITFIVSLKNEIIFTQLIEIDPMHFHNLVNLPPEQTHRNQRLLDIASEMIPSFDANKDNL